MSDRQNLAALLYSTLAVDHDDDTLVVGYSGPDSFDVTFPSWGDAMGECKRIADVALAAGWRPLRDGNDEIDLESASREELQREVLRHRGTIDRLDELLRQSSPPVRTVSTVEELEALPQGTKLYSPKTTNMWWPTPTRIAKWEGTGGGYTFTDDLLRHEGPLTVIHEGGA